MDEDLSREQFLAELDRRKPAFEVVIRNMGMLAAREYIIGSISDHLRPKRDLIDWWDRNFNLLN